MSAKQFPKLTHGLWFNNQAEEAAVFYTALFPNSSIGSITRYGKEGFEFHRQPEGSVMTIGFQLSGLHFSALNGGPRFDLNPSLTFLVICENVEEIDHYWKQLSTGGKELVPIGKYDWSERYGWIQDRFGLGWEVILGKLSDVGQKITPTFVFSGSAHGRAEEAIRFYTSVFEPSGITGMLKYKKGENEPEGTVKHAMFRLLNQGFMAVDNSQFKFNFNEAITVMINCETQAEIDYYWNRLTEGGEEGPCGWLKDRFGLSWQVESVRLQEMLEHPDKEKVARVSEAFMQMKKYDIKKLEQAFNA